MPIIAGLDIATSCGVAWVNPSTSPSLWRCLAVESEGDTVWDAVDDFDDALRSLLTETRPDFAVIERPLGVVVDYGGGPAKPGDKRMINAKTTIKLAGLAGAAIGVLNGLGIPYAMIADRTWRSAYFGQGYKPPENWKASAVEMARRQRIPLPDTKKAAHDAAEAIGIAVSWQRANTIPQRHQRAFMDLRVNHGRAA
ncbi:hypothetical protein [Mesorhizobium sp. Z1-4]|uniref:hypothetical protein n=1 Tax=Mesorhizobium sp. Z1-4 TaxID=2448478 RepID=UPI000FD898C7|nr:hypothetical protein [Mesorhizobium sp. Z1-4]